MRTLSVIVICFIFCMYKFRIIFACYMMLLLIMQTPKLNLLLRAFHLTELFATYREADRFLKWLTAGSMFVFLGVNYFAAR